MVEVRSDVPKGFKAVLKRSLLGMIPGYNVGYQAAREEAERRAAMQNKFALDVYAQQRQAWQNEQLQIYREAQLKEKYDALQQSMERAIFAQQGRMEVERFRQQKRVADFIADYGNAAALIDSRFPELNKPENAQKKSEMMAVFIRPALRFLFDDTNPSAFELKLNATNKALQEIGQGELSREQILRMAGAAPPTGTQPSTTYGWVGPDLKGEYHWGITSQRVPGVAGEPAPAPGPLPAPPPTPR